MSAESLQDRLWNEWSCPIRSAEPHGLRSCHSWHHYIREHATAVTAATRRSNGLVDLWPPIPRFPAAVASLWFSSSSSRSKLLTVEKRYLSRFSLGRGFLTVLCVSLTVFMPFLYLWFGSLTDRRFTCVSLDGAINGELHGVKHFFTFYV